MVERVKSGETMTKEIGTGKNKTQRQQAIAEYAKELETLGRLTDIVREAIAKAESMQQNYHTIFYLAGGLTGMSEEVKARYAHLSDLVASNEGMFGYAPHLHGTDPVAHPDVTPEEVRDIDYLFAAILPHFHINCWYPIAHGNAVEAGWAELANIPAIHLVPDGITLSRLVRGMRNIATTITYTDFEGDGLAKVQEFLTTNWRDS
jgi:hypothetical protein